MTVHVLQEPEPCSHVQLGSKLRDAKDLCQLNLKLVAKRGGYCAGEDGAAGPALQLRAAL